MIDYDKLRIAHEAALQTSYVIEVTLGVDEDMMDLYIRNVDDEAENYNQHLYSHTIDDLIAKLTELTKPKAKYKEGDEVWTYSHGHINSWEIEKIRWESASNDFRLDLKQNFGKGSFLQYDCYPSKAQLIEAQIEYWEAMRAREYENEVTEECQHESDGHRYDTRKLLMNYAPIDKTWQELLEIGCHNKCLKCGEFYK